MRAREMAHSHKQRVTNGGRSDAMPPCLHCTQNPNTKKNTHTQNKTERNSHTTKTRHFLHYEVRHRSSCTYVDTTININAVLSIQIHNPRFILTVTVQEPSPPGCQKQTHVRPLAVRTHLSHGREAVSGARSVGHHIHVRGVLVLVDAHHEHRGVSGWGADHHLSHKNKSQNHKNNHKK